MIIGSLARSWRTRLFFAVALVVCCLALGMGAPPGPHLAESTRPASDPISDPTVTCLPFGLYGDITTPPIVGRLSDTGGDLTFVGTSNGLYVVAPNGKLDHFLYCPFGIRHVVLIEDVTGDGIREVVVAFNDTQVPALRCYDGATWEKLWQFAPMARIWDREWVDRQLAITSLEVMAGEEAQSLVVTSGRSVFSVDARGGSQRWRFGTSSAIRRMVVLNDLDGVCGVFAGTDDGDLYWLDGRTGTSRWHTELPRHDGMMYDAIERLVSDMAIMDEASGKVVVASADGYAQIYDLPGTQRQWEARAFGQDPEGMYLDYSASDLLISLAPDISGDGLPEVLLSEATPGNQFNFAAYVNGRTSLCNSTGNIVWGKSSLACSPTGIETGTIDGQPFLLQSEAGEINLIDLKDGRSELRTVPLDALDSQDPALIVRQPAGNGYLAFSSAIDLAALSDTGAVLWSCPRLGSLTTQEGDFVGDGTPDVLFCAERFESSGYDGYVYGPKSPDGVTIYGMADPGLATGEPDIRLLAMMDGATKAIAWSYEVPYAELRDLGGLQGMMVAPDLVDHDNVPDIVGYRQDTVFIFSGRNGSLTTVPVGAPISTLEAIRRSPAGSALALATSGGLESGGAGELLVVDPAGTPLWTTTAAEWLGSESGGSLMALDDINSDNASDLALVSASRMVVLRSAPATDNYEEHLAIEARTGYYLSHVEQVPDSDGDGVPDLACIQQGQTSEQTGAYAPPPAPLLTLRSAADGEKLFEVELPAYWAGYDLACGDFNGDGCADSLYVSPSDKSVGLTMLLISGKDGSVLRAHTTETGYFAVSQDSAPPALNIGDFDGDGADDLVYVSRPGGTYEYFPEGGYVYTPAEDQRLSVWVYSPVRDEMLESVPVTPSLSVEYWGGDSPPPLAADADGDGLLEVMVGVYDPQLASYDPDASYYSYADGNSGSSIAVADLETGRRLAGFAGFNISTMSVFETHQPGTLGVAASGGAFFLRTDAGLEVTSPGNGARTGPNVGVTWEGPAEGDFSQVLVDGVRNDMTNGLEANLYLGRGEHDITVRSVDDWGRVSYAPADMGSPVTITVTPSPWRPVWLAVSLLALAAVALALFYTRLHRVWRARRRATK